jgi:hypothetical protein
MKALYYDSKNSVDDSVDESVDKSVSGSVDESIVLQQRE